MTTPGIPTPPRPCRVCAKRTTNPGQRCDDHTRTHNKQHNERTSYYRTPEWRWLRAQVIERDHNRCVIDATETRLFVHHIHARKDGGPDTQENLVTLCHSCHSKVEQGDRTTLARLERHLTDSPHH